MKPKLYIINNGLKDLRGHYFETSVSIAEASQSMGLHPVLAAHITCPADIVPAGLEFHAAFTTDHWMTSPPPPQPDLHGLRGELAPLASSSIEALENGKIGFEEFLAARFIPDGYTAQGGPRPLRLRASESLRGGKQRAKQLAKTILPLALRKVLRYHLHSSIPRLRRHFARRRHPPTDSPTLTTWERLQASLDQIGLAHESAYAIRFRQDLERLLCLTGCTPKDHVFLPTAHGRELTAILELMSCWPVELQPTFHLEFRHALALAGDGVVSEDHPYCALHRVFFDYARTFPDNSRLRLYTDSDGLAEEYEQLAGFEFGVLPIPFRSHLLKSRSRGAGPLCIGYFGDVRDEKGFHWLPDLVQAMYADHVRPGRVAFLIQASLVHAEHEPLSREAIKRLKDFAEDSVQLVGMAGPLSPESYYQLVSETDVLVCPYDPAIYRNRTSGTLAEAISAGIPTVVPHGSWLSRQQPPGSGETFLDRDSFIEAVKSVCDDYARYHSRAKAGRYSWLTRHCPESLVRFLLGAPKEQGSSVGRVA